MEPLVKICGLTTREAVEAAIAAKAAFAGFVFFPPSPRAVTVEEAEPLAEAARGWADIVALTVDADNAQIDEIEAVVMPQLHQLHGSESPERVSEIAERTGKPVIKALGIADAGDLEQIEFYADCADLLLFDARPPKNAGLGLPGGNGIAFDWSLIADLEIETPYMLSGGLTADNVAEAMAETGARLIDVSSGVEAAPGFKDPEKIYAFVSAAREAVERQFDT